MSVRTEPRYHVPRNQCFAGSRGGTKGNVHLHVLEPLHSGRLHREVGEGRSLCGRRPWWHREPEPWERQDHCPRCEDIAARHDIAWPSPDTDEGERR